MKKKQELIKTLQLILFLIITAVGLVSILVDGELYQLVGRNRSIGTLCVLLWLALGFSFVFIYMDFKTLSKLKKDYRELDFAVYNDHLAGIANRFSCDAVIEKYADRPLPENVGCIMLDISNIGDINRNHGRTAGNAAIQAFSDILNTASVGLCFVGRNGGNKFMALFEACDDAKLNSFQTRLSQRMQIYNLQDDVPKIEYRSGCAFHEGAEVASITQLIALADRRATARMDTVGGIPNRTSCDEIISQYMDKPLPDGIGCVMLDITNLQEVNKQHGYTSGNRMIRHFSDILRTASSGLCFAGRNGGTRFMALFETCTREKMETFLQRVGDAVKADGDTPDAPAIRYTWGSAFEEGEEAKNINELVALANRRIHDHDGLQ